MKRKSDTIVIAGHTLQADAAVIASVASAMGLGVMEARTHEAAIARAKECRAALMLVSSYLSGPEADALSSGLDNLRKRPLVIALRRDRGSSRERETSRLAAYHRLSSPLDSKLLASTIGQALEAGLLQHRIAFLKKLIQLAAVLIPISVLSGMLLGLA